MNIPESSKAYKEARLVKSIVGENCTIGDYSELIKSNLSDFVVINRRNYISDSSIGLGTYTGHNVTIKNTQIGKFCSLSWNLSLGGKNHNYKSTTTFPGYHWSRILGNEQESLTNQYKDTIVGNDVWIGSGAIILRGVKIGNGAIIGAGAVVTKDVDSYEIVAGIPAKVIKKRFDEKVIEQLECIAWWDWSIELIHENIELIRADITEENLRSMLNIKNNLKEQ